MSLFLPTCAEAVALLTDYEEGALGPLRQAGLTLHLGLCPPCRALLDGLRRAPSILLRNLEPGPEEPAAERALDGALALLRAGLQPRGPQHHPEAPSWAALAPGGDPLLALLLRLHLAHCEACRNRHGAGQALPLGEGPLATLKAALPSGGPWQWTRRGLGGAEVARLLVDPGSGATLALAHLPSGRPMPQHDHPGLEISLVLAGGMQDGPAHLRPGDWLAAAPGSRHSPAADADGCWALVRLEGGLRFTGWRSLLGRVG